MIVFGAASKHLATTELDEGSCRVCGATGVTLAIKQQFFHVYGIPMFPTTKLVEAQCRGCKHLYGKNEFFGDLDTEVARARRNARAPIWTFTGVALIAVGILYYGAHEYVKSNNTADYLAHPQQNDLLILPLAEDSAYKYAIIKVGQIVGDSIMLSVGNELYMNSSDAERSIDEGRFRRGDFFIANSNVSKEAFARLTERYREDAVAIRGKDPR